MTLLRQGLLEGRAVALAGGVRRAIGDALGGLGRAGVEELDVGLDEERASSWAAAAARLHALVYDAATGVRGRRRRTALRETLERGVGRGARGGHRRLIPAGAGKVVLIGPRPDAGSFATRPARAREPGADAVGRVG